MAATVYDFTIEQGTVYVVQFTYKTINDTPVDLSNHCIVLRIQPVDGPNTSVITLTTQGSYVTTSYSFTLDATNGQITLKIPAETTNSYKWSSASYELEIIEPNLFYEGGSRVIKRLVQGQIRIQPRLISADFVSSCSQAATNEATIADSIETSSYGIADSCVGSPCEFIGGNATIYTLYDTVSDQSVLYLRDKANAFNENPYGISSPFPISINVTDNKILERIDVLIDGFSHTNPTDIRMILTHNGSGVLLFDNNKFTSNNRPKNLSFILSDYANMRPDGSEPAVLNVRNYQDALIADKNLAVALPGTKSPASLTFPLAAAAFAANDSNRNISVYGSGLKTFEGMNVSGLWSVYAMDYNEGDLGQINSIKLIAYFQNESSNSNSNFNSCGFIPRDINLNGTEITMDGDLTSQLSDGDTVIIEYNNGSGLVTVTRKIVGSVTYSNQTGDSTFNISASIIDTSISYPKLSKYISVI
jgi:hypothetical protein